MVQRFIKSVLIFQADPNQLRNHFDEAALHALGDSKSGMGLNRLALHYFAEPDFAIDRWENEGGQMVPDRMENFSKQDESRE